MLSGGGPGFIAPDVEQETMLTAADKNEFHFYTVMPGLNYGVRQ